MASEKFKFEIPNSGLDFALQLHSKTNFARKDVFFIQNLCKEKIILPILNNVQTFFTEHLDLDSEKRLNLSGLLQELENPFEFCDTDFKLFKTLKEKDLIDDFEEFFINNELKDKNGEVIISNDAITGVLLPLKFQFQKIFERDDLLLKTIKKMEEISKSSYNLNHFIQGQLWKEKSKNHLKSEKILIPFFLYIDDCEINNPLGSHTGAITFLYYSFPVIEYSPTDLACLFSGKDYKAFGNQNCLYRLIAEINSLEENGIAIQTTEGIKTVHFMLGLVLGDNLGLNTVLGFCSSFSANYFCRFCKSHKNCTHTLKIEDKNTLRNRENYAVDVLTNNSKETGIVEDCIFHTIKSFHVTTNYAADIMHDIFEGVCNYNMCHIIDYLINVKQYFSFSRLNSRKHVFNYGPIEIGNVSNDIKPHHVTNFKLKMTAREMMTFVHFFPQMVGDLVQADDEVWDFLINFLELIDFLMYFEMSLDLVTRIQFLIQKHHTDYVRLFQDTLKPKHHLMVHYFSVILQSGPPRKYWCFPFEKQHKAYKTYARSITSRKNVCMSISKKFQLQFAESLLQASAIDNVITINPRTKIDSDHITMINKFKNDVNLQSNFDAYSDCCYFGKHYKCGYHLISRQGLINNIDYIKLYEIQEIIIFSDSKELPYVLCRGVQITNYNKHLASYEIDNNHYDDFYLLSIDYFSGPPININTLSTGKSLVRVKNYY